MSLVSTTDTLGRLIGDLRISVTDRCNFRCTYCMPFDEYVWIQQNQVLSFEEIVRLATIFTRLGVHKVRLTGGEPLVRRGLDQLVRQLASLPGLDLTLTTNGALLGEQAAGLFAAGLRRINVSLDTLRADRFHQMTQRGELAPVLAGIQEARRVGISPIKLNAVVIQGVNDDEILDLVRYAREGGMEARFIEYMDVGNANGWTLAATVTKQQIFNTINAAFPIREIGRAHGSAPAVDYEFLDGAGKVGIIGSVTEPFCSSCTRVRLTADGKLVTCLFSETGVDLRDLLRSGATDEEIQERITATWQGRSDRYSDLRWESIKSGDGYKPAAHRKIEMITLGG